MPEYTLEEVRRLFMVVSLHPGVAWEKKTEYYNTSAVACGGKQRTASALKSYWAVHNRQWCTAHILNDPPYKLPEGPNPQNQQKSLTAQSPESLPEPQDEGDQHSTPISGYPTSYVGQDQVQHEVPAINYSTSYVGPESFGGQGHQYQEHALMAQLPANQVHSPYPTHPTPIHSWSFGNTADGELHFPHGWTESHGGNGLLNGAAYLSPPTNFVACNPILDFPQTTHSQGIEPYLLREIPEENLADHEVDVQDTYTEGIEEGSEENDSATTIEEESGDDD